jgi:hypothetical protein
MSNRFHNKWHRRNHHTYGNNSNPDAGHDPIASPQQPFLGDFSLSGSLSAVAPLSAFAAYLYTNNTGLCAYAGRVGAFIHSYGYMGANIESMVYGVSAYAPYVAIAATSPTIGLSAYADYNAIRAYSPTRAISAYGGGVAGEFGSPLIALSANGGLIGAQIYSPRTALSAYGSRIGVEVYSNNLCLSGYSPLTGVKVEAGLVGGQFRSRVISLSTGGGGINIFNSRTGIYKEPKDYYGSPQQQAGQVVLDVGGDVWIDGACTIMGDLSAYGTITYLDTKVSVTSSLLVNNKGTDAAATFIQTGAQPILRCFDQDIDTPLSTPSFIVDGATNGWVGIGVATPTAPFTIVKDSSTNQLGSANQPHVRIYDGTANKIILGTYGTNNGGTNAGGTTNPYIGTENSAPFDIITSNDTRMTFLANGNVGINDSSVGIVNSKLSIYANANSNNTALSAYGTTYGAIIAGGETRINYDGNGNTSINSANTTTATVNIGTTGAASSNVNVKGNTTVNFNCTTNTTGIGTGNTTGAITIGNTGLTGGIAAYGSPISLNPSSAGYQTNIATGTTTGAVTIGNTGLTGGVAVYGSPIALNTSAAGYQTNIGTGTTTGKITIGNTGLTGGIELDGATISINDTAGTYTTNIGTGTTTGKVTIGNTGLTGGVEVDGATVTINATAGSYTTNINTGTTTGNVQIGNTTGATTALVGIGTSPSVRLDISNSTSAPKSVTNANGTVVHVTQVEGNPNRILADAFGTAATARASFTGRTANGTVATPTATLVDTVLCEITGQGYGATNYSATSLGRMTINAAETWTDTAQGTYLTFQTATIGVNSASERVRINDAGSLLIGTTTDSGKLTVNGSISLAGTTNSTININTGSSGNAVTNIHTTANSSALGLGNSSGNTNIAANALGITTAGQVDINSSTARTTNINTGTGSVTTTIGNAGTVTINGTVGLTGSVSLNNNASTNTTNIATGSTTGTVAIGNNTVGATTTILGATTTINGTSVSIGSANTSTLNIGTLGGLATTQGNSSGAHTLNSNNITAPNQVVNADASVLTRTAADSRYGQQLKYFRTSDLSRQSTVALADDDVLIIPAASLLANKTYSIECVLNFASGVTTNGARIAFNDTSSPTNVSITVIYGPNGAASVAGYTSLAAASNTTTVASGTTPITFTIQGTFRTSASPGNVALQWAQGTSIASNTTLKAGSYLSATLLG